MRLPPRRSSLVRITWFSAFTVLALRLPAQTPAPPPLLANWTGAVRCELQSQAPGYAHTETQTWTLSGPPAVQGSVIVYPATWTVSGQGWHDRTRNNFRRVARWTADVPGASAPSRAAIGFIIRPVGGGLEVVRRNAQLTRSGGYAGPEQYINDGVPQPPGRLVATVYEWGFAKIEGVTAQSPLTGTSTAEVKAFLGPLQPADAIATVSCAWSLGRGTAPPLPPATMSPPPPPATIALGGTSPAVASGGAGSPTASSSASTAATTVAAPTSISTSVAGAATVTAAPTSSGASTLAGSTMVAGGAQTAGATLGTVSNVAPAPAPTTSSAGRMGAGVPTSPSALPICTASSGSANVITSMPQRNSSPTILTNPPAPAPTCVTIAQRLADLQAYVADGVASLTAVLTSLLSTLTTAAPCTQTIADIDAAFAAMLQTMQAEYARLLAAASTATEQSAVAKAQADGIAQLTTWRDKAVAEVNKQCVGAK